MFNIGSVLKQYILAMLGYIKYISKISPVFEAAASKSPVNAAHIVLCQAMLHRTVSFMGVGTETALEMVYVLTSAL